MEYTKCFALQTPAGEQVGFMLGATSFKGEAGECVFMLLPAKAELVDSALGMLIAELKVAGEHKWKKHGPNILVSLDDHSALEITDDALVLDGTGNMLGKAVSVPEKR